MPFFRCWTFVILCCFGFHILSIDWWIRRTYWRAYLEKTVCWINNDTVDATFGWWKELFCRSSLVCVGAKVYRILLEVRTLILMSSTIRARGLLVFKQFQSDLKLFVSLEHTRLDLCTPVFVQFQFLHLLLPLLHLIHLWESTIFIFIFIIHYDHSTRYSSDFDENSWYGSTYVL